MQFEVIDNFWIWVDSIVQLVWNTGELFYNLIPLIPMFYPFDWVVHMIIFPGLGFIGIGVMGIVWLERKTLAKVNLRIGPLYAGRYFGILQLVADVTKMLQKIDAEKFCSGHDETVNRKIIKNHVDRMKKRQKKVKTLIDDGKSLEEIKSEFQQNEGRLIEAIYNDLRK